MKRRAAASAFVLGLLGASGAQAEEPSAAREPTRATFAVIIGSNRSVDTNLPPLKYADDDASRYFDLFRLLGARTYLLTRPDDNTARLHAQAAAEAKEPKKATFDATFADLAKDVAQAAERKVETTVYVVYAGHGNVENGRGYVTLEDARIGGGDFAQLFARVPATRIHLIVDACASYYLAYGRGPGGQRRPVESLATGGALAQDPRVGLILSTSSARESHEWEQFQSGVFSHEIRSGLYGAADADSDGNVTYREIAAFVARANAAVPNERYRPEVHTRAPKGDDALLDIKRAKGRRVEIDGRHAGHWFVEDARGVRLADAHNAVGQSLSFIRPAPASVPLYLRRTDDDLELAIPQQEDVVAVEDLAARDGRVASRGAAHESFGKLFALPFDRSVVEEWTPPAEEAPVADAPSVGTPALSTRRLAGLVTMGAGVLVGGGGVFLSISATNLKGDLPATASQAEAADTNDSIRTRNTLAGVAYAVGGAAIVTGALLFLLSDSKQTIGNVSVAPLPSGGFVGWGKSF
jgi:hypothetical protein